MNENFDSLIVLKHFNNEIDAEMLVEHLQLRGIFAFIRKDDPAAMGLIRSARVIVHKSDREKAQEILRDLDTK